MLPEAPERWRLDPDVCFLNHGSFGACPGVVLDAQQRLRDAMEAEPLDFLVVAWDRASEAVEAPARMLGLPAGDTVFVDNATTAVNAVLRSLPLGPGDRVLLLSHAYEAVAKAVRYVCDRSGAEPVVVELPFPIAGADEVLAAVDAVLERTDGIRVAVVDQVPSKTALLLPVGALVARLEAAGIPVLVDGAHVPGQFPVDVGSLGASWWTGNLHKWAFAPKGAAVLHVRPDLQPVTRPLVISHGYGDGLHREFHWQGTRDPTAWLSAPAAIAFLEELGPARLWEHNRSLAHEGAELLADAWSVRRPAPPELCGAMVTLPVPVGGPATLEASVGLHDALRAEGIEVPVFPFADRLWLRISAQAYNRLDDYERLAHTLPRVCR